MGRKSSVETHPERNAIEGLLADRSVGFREISERFDVSIAALHRHLHQRFAEKVAKARELQDGEDGDRIYQEIRAVMERCQKLYDAADKWLTDPENPEKYYIGPRADEVVVYYQEEQGKATVQRSATLQELLDNIGRDVIGHRTKYADPRELLLKTAQTLSRQLELLGEIAGKIRRPGGDRFIELLMEIHNEGGAKTGGAPGWAEVRRARDRKEVE